MASTPHSELPISIGHVGLVLLRDENGLAFYLEIPLDIIRDLCKKPRKYLVYLGWCVLGCEGKLALEGGGEIDDVGDLEEQVTYRYARNAPEEDPGHRHMVDRDVISRRSPHSVASTSREDFKNILEDRDCCCVWTGGAMFAEACHIIPFRRGSEWLRTIVVNRTCYDENVTTLKEINDVRNGFLANPTLHKAFDSGTLAILKTPNHVLDCEDIPEAPNSERKLHADTRYPTGRRYVLHWLAARDLGLADVPNNTNAAFKTDTENDQPSGLLLHYTYGARAIKLWGRGTDVLKALVKHPRPDPVPQSPMGPTKTQGDRKVAIRKRERHQNDGAGGGSSLAGTGTEGLPAVELEDEMLDGDEVMMFFWTNSKVARERRFQEAKESFRRMERWRGEVVQNPVASF